MVDLSTGQLAARAWSGLAPFWWGWIVAGLAVFVSLSLLALPRRPTAPTPHTTAPQLRWWAAAVVIGAVLLHLPGLAGDFNVLDDYGQIHTDPTIIEFTAANLWKTTLGGYKGTNQETMYLSFQLNWLVAGGRYWVWYLANLATLPLILLLLRRMTVQLTNDHVAGLIAMAVFATTPQTAELMAWISVRSHLYGLLFTLVCCVTYLNYTKLRGRQRWLWLAMSITAFALTQVSKPIFAFVPAWLVLFDIYLGRRERWLSVCDKVPYAMIAVAFVLRIALMGVGNRLIATRWLGDSITNTLWQDLNLLVEYGRVLFVPVETGILPAYNEALGPLYVQGDPQVLVNGFAPVASLIVLVCVLAAALILRFRHQWGLGLLWFVGCLVTFCTVMNVPNRGFGATFEYRYATSAQVLTAILLGWCFAALLRRRAGATWRWVPLIATVAYLTWCANVTHSMTQSWDSSYSYWTRNAQLYPRGYNNNHFAAIVSQRRGRHYRALQYLRACERHNPDDLVIHKRRMGDGFHKVGDLQSAKQEWSDFFGRKPHFITAAYLKKFEQVGMQPSDIGRTAWPKIKD